MLMYFYAWVTQELIKYAPKNAVIVMDNATFHKRKDIIEAIERASLSVDFLPPYSPDLNPIEKTWARLKALRRKMRCSIEELFQGQNLNQSKEV